MSRATLQADSFLVDDRADDWDLLRRYIDLGSEEAFSELVNRHLAWVHATCRKSLRDRQLAEDAAQAVFIIFARRAATIPPQARLSGWLFNTARFVVKDVLKQRSRYRRREEIARELAVERLAPPKPAVDSETQATLDDALATLTERDRQALLMHFYEGLSLGEMADVLEISKEGVKKRVSRALGRLRIRIGKHKKRTGASLVAIAVLLRGNAASALPLGLQRSVITAATVPGRASVVAQWMAQQAMHAVAGASGRLLRAALATELLGALATVGVWSIPSKPHTAAPLQASSVTQTLPPQAAVKTINLPPAKAAPNPPAVATTPAEPPYHSGAFDPEPKIPELAHARPTDKKASESTASEPDQVTRASQVASTYAGVAPVSRAPVWTTPATPVVSKRALPEGGGQAVIGAAAPSARAPDTSVPPGRATDGERKEDHVANCLALLTHNDKLDPKFKPHHDMEEPGAQRGFHPKPMMHHRLGEPEDESPIEIASLTDEQEDWLESHVRRDLDKSHHLRRPTHRHHDWDFIDISNCPTFDPLQNPCDHGAFHVPGSSDMGSYLAPGELVATPAPEPTTLSLLSLTLATLTLRRRRRRS